MFFAAVPLPVEMTKLRALSQHVCSHNLHTYRQLLFIVGLMVIGSRFPSVPTIRLVGPGPYAPFDIRIKIQMLFILPVRGVVGYERVRVFVLVPVRGVGMAESRINSLKEAVEGRPEVGKLLQMKREGGGRRRMSTLRTRSRSSRRVVWFTQGYY